MIDELRSAPLGRRAAAFAIDAALVVVAAIPAIIGWAGLIPAVLSGGFDPGEILETSTVSVVLVIVGAVLSAAAQVVTIVLAGRRGVTLGTKLMSLRVVNVQTLERPGVGRMLLRAVALAAAGILVPGLGGAVMLASPLWANNTRSRGWLDLIGGTWFVDIRDSLNPYDAKAVRLVKKRLETPPIDDDAAVPSLATGDADAAPVYIPGPRSRSSIVGAPLVAGHVEADVDAVPAKAPVIAQPPAPAKPTAPAAPAAALVSSDGLRYELTGPALVGRNPSPLTGQPPIARISILDDTFSISKTHARLEPAADGVWVVDLNSSNGSAVRAAGDLEVELAPSNPHLAPWGSTLSLGDREFIVTELKTVGGVHA